MTERILFVDDDPNILQSIKRQFRKRFSLEVAEGGEQALELLKRTEPFAVIVTDMRMPGMNGVELLGKVKDLYPEMVRLMLTGNADQETAMEAVNTGHVFRFLTKPCPPATFITAIALAQRQHRLLTAEKELLQQTLKGSINVLSELLSIANPVAFSSGLRIKRFVVTIAAALGLPGLWQYEIAALMSQIGCVTLPAEIINKVYSGQSLSPEEAEMYANHPAIGARLLEKIPRLENVTTMIALQQQPFEAYGEEAYGDIFEEVQTGAQILKAVIEFDLQLFRGIRRSEIIKELTKQRRVYNPSIVDQLAGLKAEPEKSIVTLPVKSIAPGMVATEDVMAKNGVLVIPKGQKITWPLVQGLKNFARQVGIIEPIRVELGQTSGETTEITT
ncbi:HD domain-containing phosphohydrolase [Desulfogranum mediterraneum]|uniref:HD domain-containing phosphohydrolase n=1 Tax=Desulfogranum mediterraneum TaxID=160661 RepID=UPI0003F971C9|nr:HD domain-containing phosphohydrolase [Desulfogranum mediterraneum]